MEKEKQPVYRKWWFWGIIIVILILGILAYTLKQANTELNSYKNQAIAVLTQYKNGKLTRKETREKIDEIADKSQSEYEINNEINISYLQGKLSVIALKLFDKELSNTEIETYIQEIKKLD